MSIHTETVESIHSYTRANVPWELAERGMMRAHGRDVRQMERARRQRRFLIFTAVFFAVWSVLYFT